MIDTITRFLSGVADGKDREAIRGPINALGDRYSTQSLRTAGLAIKAGASAIVKTGAADYYGIAQGKLVLVAASTDMPALVGTVTNAYFNVFCFYIDSASTVTAAMGTEATTLAGVKFPALPIGKAQLGFIIVNPTGTGNFVGGTTALDDATVAPNVVYINTMGPFDPSVLI